ncbi:BMC domain-containing protein [Terrisporobacter mayombei]|uniref:BMC domain-containing protein n=1 Tax=Terrisporobacter mayombei TaxID=1541 RepID=A0ABY9Q0W8_9FIRM|nr:BMC domain-containing protein [Terrisporobacter mayombei]MCC3866612.1 BMC domain-containing protein [Terrisporobacter mayombei]WMT80846.1 hypothetical protein TEMA_11680 [Terrisporobacter mayombei]
MNAIGLVEVIGYVAAIQAGDASLKSANVNLLDITKVGSGIVTLIISGDVGAVKSAVEAAENAVLQIGKLRSTHVIPRIDKSVGNILLKKEEPKINIKEEPKDLDTKIPLIKEEPIEEKLEEEKAKDLDSSLNNLNNSLDIENEKKDIKNIEIEDKEQKKEFDKEYLSKLKVKELKSLIKKLDSSFTNKDLNSLKKEELIQIIENLSKGDK